MKASALFLTATVSLLTACAAAPQHPTASTAAPAPNPEVVTVTGEDIKLTGHTDTAAALRELVPSVH